MNQAGAFILIDNTNPSDPENISFINIPGNCDLAVKDNYLYADFVDYPGIASTVKITPSEDFL